MERMINETERESKRGVREGMFGVLSCRSCGDSVSGGMERCSSSAET